MKRIDFYIGIGIMVLGFLALAYFQNKASIVPEPDKVTIINKIDSTAQSAASIIQPHITVQAGKLPDNIIQILQDSATALALGDNMFVLMKMMERYFEYNAQHVLTYTPDSLHLINTVDTITENGIVGRMASVQCFKPATTITIEKAPVLKNKMFIGGNIEAGQHGFTSIGPEVSLLTKKEWLYQIGWNGYEAVKGNPYNFSISAHWKIGKKRTP